MLFTLIVPACNEEATIRNALEVLVDSLEEAGVTFEILVVNDGSRDATGKIADEVCSGDERMRVLHGDRNRGLGAAMRTGIAAARGEYILGCPVDSPLDAKQIRTFREAMEGVESSSGSPAGGRCDVVVGYREERPGYKVWMRFCSGVYRWMLRLAFRAWLRDFNWICAYRRSVFERVEIEFDGIVALPEILVKAKRAGMSFRQVPCPMKPRKVGRGTVSRPGVLFKAFADFARLWWRVTIGGAGSSRAREARR